MKTLRVDYKKMYEKVQDMTRIYKVKYKNDIDLLDIVVSIYSITKKKKKDQILPFEKSILIYYIISGFNPETKQDVKRDLGKSDNSINTTNTNLRKKGYLIRDSKNHTKGYIVEDLQNMADTFRKDPSKLFTLYFHK